MLKLITIVALLLYSGNTVSAKNIVDEEQMKYYETSLVSEDLDHYNENNERTRTKTEFIGETYIQTGYKKIPGQPAGGYKFETGGYIYYKDGNGNIPANYSVSIAGKLFGFSVGFGGVSTSGIYINFPKSTTYQHAYVNKTLLVRAFDVYTCSAANTSLCTYSYSFSTQQLYSLGTRVL
ncbi:MAG: hypothetical protein ACRCZJ_04635 [Erysipelotrichaceae bacterium]